MKELKNMPKYYSPTGNYEVWDTKPDGYYTYEEWKELHPDPEPTKEEKLAVLDSQYDSEKAELIKYYGEALIVKDADLQAELKAELEELDADYVEQRRRIEHEN
jgi:hypothetical protein